MRPAASRPPDGLVRRTAGLRGPGRDVTAGLLGRLPARRALRRAGRAAGPGSSQARRTGGDARPGRSPLRCRHLADRAVLASGLARQLPAGLQGWRRRGSLLLERGQLAPLGGHGLQTARPASRRHFNLATTHSVADPLRVLMICACLPYPGPPPWRTVKVCFGPWLGPKFCLPRIHEPVLASAKEPTAGDKSAKAHFLPRHAGQVRLTQTLATHLTQESVMSIPAWTVPGLAASLPR